MSRLPDPFKIEGALLLAAERSSDSLERRVRSAHKSVRTFTLSRDELHEIATTFARVVGIARSYHLAAAKPETPAA